MNYAANNTLWYERSQNCGFVVISLTFCMLDHVIETFSFYIIPQHRQNTSTAQWKKDVIPLLMHWSYVFLALTYRHVVVNSQSRKIRTFLFHVVNMVSADGEVKSHGISLHVIDLLSNLYYKLHQIPKLKCFSSCLAVVFAQSIEARCQEWRCRWSSTDRDDAPTTFEWSTSLLPTNLVHLTLDVWQ